MKVQFQTDRFLTKKTSFKAHPDFYKLAKDYEIDASSWFRRGRAYGCASREYPDLINSLKDIFKPEEPNEKKPDNRAAGHPAAGTDDFSQYGAAL